MLGFNVFVIFLLVLFIFIVIAGVKVVPQGYNYTVERFGRYTRTLRPGLTLIIPFIDRIGRKLNVMEQVIEVPSQEVITKDNAMVRVDGVAFFQVLDAAQASYEVTNLQIAILNLTMTNIRTVMGSMDLDKLLSERDEINHRLLKVVDDATHNWGVKVTRIEIKDIEPPRDLINSMARQMKAERDKRAANPGRRRRAAGRHPHRRRLKAGADPRRRRTARGCLSRRRGTRALGEAEAKATQVVSEAIGKGSVQAINYFVANNYIGALKALAEAKNQKVLIMPVEASSVIGAIAGVSEIAREAFGSGGERLAIRLASQPRRQAAWRLGSNRLTVRREIMDTLAELGLWNWMILAAILFVLEITAPGIFLMWFGSPRLHRALAFGSVSAGSGSSVVLLLSVPSWWWPCKYLASIHSKASGHCSTSAQPSSSANTFVWSIRS